MQQERFGFLANNGLLSIEKEGLQPSFNYINTSGMIRQVTDKPYTGHRRIMLDRIRKQSLQQVEV